MLSRTIYIKRYGLRWQDAPSVYGPYKTSYNRFARLSRMGIFAWPASNSSTHSTWVWGKPGLLDYGTRFDPRRPPQLREILYDEIRSVMAAG